MALFKSSMNEYPFICEWKIAENRLRALKETTTSEFLKTDVLTVFNISPVKYYLSFYPNGFNQGNRGEVWIAIYIAPEKNKAVESEYRFSVESNNWKSDMKSKTFEGYFPGYSTCICKTEEFFNPGKKYFTDGKFVIKIAGTFKIAKNELEHDIDQDHYRTLWDIGFEDFKIIVEEKEIQVHKCVLASRSPVFAAMFRNSTMKEAIENQVVIPEFSFETVEKAVKLCYYRELVPHFTIEEAMEIFKFAEKYDITVIKNNIEIFMCNKLSMNNLCEFATFATEANALKLQDKCVDFIVDGLSSKKLKSKMLKELDKDFVFNVLQKFDSEEYETN